MSKIKDLLAEEQNIDDLKQPLYQKLGEMIYVKAKSWDGLRSWFRSNAEYDAGKDDDGHTEWYFENFEDLCKQAVNGALDNLIEEEHLDISDETYNRAIEYGGDWLADTLADFESECIQDIEYARDWLADALANALADFESECIQDYVMDRKYILDEVKERNGQC